MDVVVRVDRHVEIEDMAEPGDIKPAGGDVARHHDPDVAVLEFLKRLGAFGLGHVAMQGDRVEIMPLQGLRKNVNVALAIAEYERVLDVLGFQQMPQRPALIIRPQHGHALGDIDGCRGRWCNRDFLGVHQEGVGQPTNFRRHGRGEEQRLANPWQQRDDAFDIRDKAHVEHSIRFVDDQDPDIGHQNFAALKKIDQSTRRRDQDIDAAIKLAFLIAETLASDEERHGERAVFSIGFEGLRNLCRQFAGRLQDQGPWHTCLRAAAGKDVDQRERERGRLACACLRTAENVPPHQDIGDCLRLNRRRRGVASIGYSVHQFGREAQIGK